MNNKSEETHSIKQWIFNEAMSNCEEIKRDLNCCYFLWVLFNDNELSFRDNFAKNFETLLAHDITILISQSFKTKTIK